VTITSNYGRCSALVLTNTSKRLDLYQHKASMQLTASHYVPQLDWIRPIRICHVWVQNGLAPSKGREVWVWPPVSIRIRRHIFVAFRRRLSFVIKFEWNCTHYKVFHAHHFLFTHFFLPCSDILKLRTTYLLKVIQLLPDDAHSSAASSRLNWLPLRFKWTRPFRCKTWYGVCACAITFQTQNTSQRTLSLNSTNQSLHEEVRNGLALSKGRETCVWPPVSIRSWWRIKWNSTL